MSDKQIVFHVVAHLPVRHPAYCAVHDPTPGHCDCGAKGEPLVRLSDALVAVEALRHDLTRKEKI